MSKQEKVENTACKVEEVKEMIDALNCTLQKLQQFQIQLREYLEKQPKK